ncbi:MAG: TonB-dependent receptor [Bacteroidetes bacterium]|nr:TonB-dependent receptor [Bacteroidota bacterium]
MISRKTEIKFIYSSDNIDLNQKISINFHERKVSDFFSEILQPLGISYKIIAENNILLFKENKPVAIKGVAINVSGHVVNEKGDPMPNVSVIIKGTDKGTVTDDRGRYVINVPEANSVLLFSYVGYAMQEIAVAGQSIVNVQLVATSAQLDQAVVVGYGTQKKKDITGSIAVVSGKEMEDRPNVEFGYSLEGKAAGVQVMRSSGQPQAGFSIRIRGTSSITSGSDPLYIVDGVPTASINEINPSDIASFSILKDAASAAIYGASGANGVVLITTKRGVNGDTKVEADIYSGFSSVRKKLPVLNANQYIALMQDLGQSVDQLSRTTNTNWQDQLFRNGLSQNYNVSMRGGTQKTLFYLSLGLVKQNGIIINNTMNRANFTANIDHTINKVFKVGTNISYNRWYDVDVTEGSRNSVLMNTLIGSPTIGIWDSTGQQFTTDPYRLDLDNPIGLAIGNKHNWINNRFLGNVYVEATLLPGLKARAMLGYEKYNGAYNSFVDPYQTTEGRGKKGIAELYQNSNEYWISENTLNYNQQLGKSNLSAMAGFIATKTNNTNSDILTRNFANANITTVNGGSIIDAATAATTYITTTSFMSRATYNFDEKYILSANFRADASSVFGPDNRWGYFPAFAAAWRISKESFFKEATFINDLKLRGSWGQVGNSQIPAYSYLGIVAPSGSYVIGDVVVPGYTPTTLSNPILKWETTKQTDIGLDMTILDNRLTITSDYYIKKTIGLLLQSPVAASSGYTTALKNVGSLQNKGFEFAVTSKNLVGKLQWTTDFNISFNRNKVLNIEKGIIYDGNIDSRGNASIAKEGLPLGTFYGYVAKGVDPNTGNMIYKIADTTQGLQTSDMAVIGNPNPKYYFGFTNTFKYRQWDLSVFIQGVQGNDILNATRIYTEGMWEPRNQSAAVVNRWSHPGQITNIPSPDLNNTTTSYPNYNSLVSSRFVENGSYVRLKSITLAYNLSENALKKIGLKNIKMYATAENLLTFTKYSGFDPEVNAYGSSNTALGIDFGSYPQTRDLIFGINISF